ncbi:MAG TPA: SRPBCC domain-containing protein [Phenylobacterium sp.]
MEEPAVVHSTFVIERTYPKPPEAVFAAFADPQAKRRWYADGQVDLYENEFKVGGRERVHTRMPDSSPFPGAPMIHEGVYTDIVENRRIVIASSMALRDHRFSTSQTTFEFLKGGEGAVLICTHQGAFFENSDGPQMREHGWRALLDKLDRTLAA